MKEAGLMWELQILTDSEPAIVRLAEVVASKRAAPTVVECTPTRSSDSLGLAEKWAQGVAGLTRTVRLAIQK